MRLYDGGASILIILSLATLFGYIAGVYNWSAHCPPGGLDPPGCRPRVEQPK